MLPSFRHITQQGTHLPPLRVGSKPNLESTATELSTFCTASCASAESSVQVISTFQTAAELGPQSLGAYVISMANTASDVLAVELLQKEALLTVGNTRFVSSKSAAQLNMVSPLDAQAHAGASMGGQVSAPFMVPATVHGSRGANLHSTTSDASINSGMLVLPVDDALSCSVAQHQDPTLRFWCA